MQVAARMAAWAKSGYTAKDYVQDGLVAMWDGIENVGYGQHQETPSQWVNLVSGSAFSNFKIESGKSFGEDHLIVNGLTAESLTPWPTSLTSYLVLEKCYRIDSGYAFFSLNLKSRIEWFLNVGYGIFSGIGSNNKAFWDSDFEYGKHNSLSIHYKSDGDGANSVFINKREIDDIRSSGQNTNAPSLTCIGSRKGILSSFNSSTGIMNSIRLYNRYLTAEEVRHNYAIDKARFGLT